MKILMVAPYFYPKIGGMENYAYNISKGLKDKYDWEVIVVTSNHKGNNYIEEVIEGIKIYRLVTWFKVSNTPINPLWLFDIRRILRIEHPDIINVHSPVPFISDITSIVAGAIPLVTTYHAGSMLKESSVLNPLIKLYESMFLKLLFDKSSKIICVSPVFVINNIHKYGNKIINITPGVDVKEFRPSSIKPKNDILYVGRIEKNSDWKGIKYLLAATASLKQSLPGIKLRLVGAGDRINHFQKLSETLNINKNVSFVGSKTGIELVHEYQDSKLLVLPSTTESESFGMVLIEAMACKKSVVGTKIGGIPFVIDDQKNGLLVPPKDSKALANAIVKVLKNPKLAKKMGDNGYEKVSKLFGWDNKIQITNSIFIDVIKNAFNS